MKKEMECKIVQDLLPSYIEKLTSSESNDFIERHLKTCDKCKNTLECMSKNIKPNGKIDVKSDIKYFKKFKFKIGKWKFISLILIVLVIVGICKMYYNYSLCNEISEKNKRTLSEYQNADNFKYSFFITSQTGGSEAIHLYKNGIRVEKIKNENGIFETTRWYNDNTKEYIELYHNLNGRNIAVINSDEHSDSNYIMNNFGVDGISWLGNNWVLKNVSIEKIDGKSYFVTQETITGTRVKAYFDTETGLMRRVVHKSEDGHMMAMEIRDLEKGVVTDEEVQRPDLQGFEIMDHL